MIITNFDVTFLLQAVFKNLDKQRVLKIISKYVVIIRHCHLKQANEDIKATLVKKKLRQKICFLLH